MGARSISTFHSLPHVTLTPTPPHSQTSSGEDRGKDQKTQIRQKTLKYYTLASLTFLLFSELGTIERDQGSSMK